MSFIFGAECNPRTVELLVVADIELIEGEVFIFFYDDNLTYPVGANPGAAPGSGDALGIGGDGFLESLDHRISLTINSVDQVAQLRPAWRRRRRTGRGGGTWQHQRATAADFDSDPDGFSVTMTAEKG